MSARPRSAPVTGASEGGERRLKAVLAAGIGMQMQHQSSFGQAPPPLRPQYSQGREYYEAAAPTWRERASNYYEGAKDMVHGAAQRAREVYHDARSWNAGYALQYEVQLLEGEMRQLDPNSQEYADKLAQLSMMREAVLRLRGLAAPLERGLHAEMAPATTGGAAISGYQDDDVDLTEMYETGKRYAKGAYYFLADREKWAAWALDRQIRNLTDELYKIADINSKEYEDKAERLKRLRNALYQLDGMTYGSHIGS